MMKRLTGSVHVQCASRGLFNDKNQAERDLNYVKAALNGNLDLFSCGVCAIIQFDESTHASFFTGTGHEP